MTQEKKHISKSPIKVLKNSFKNFLSSYTTKYPEVFEVLSRPATPFGGNLIEAGHLEGSNSNHAGENQESSTNRYSVLYTMNAQYQHIGCSSQSEAQNVLGMLMTDGNRIPVGIYDAKTDLFEWEIIGQYFHSQDPISEQRSRLEEILTIARALRRRDSSWDSGYLQKPSFFA